MEPGPVKDALSAAAASFVAEDAALSRRAHRSRLVALPDRGRLSG